MLLLCIQITVLFKYLVENRIHNNIGIPLNCTQSVKYDQRQRATEVKYNHSEKLSRLKLANNLHLKTNKFPRGTRQFHTGIFS